MQLDCHAAMTIPVALGIEVQTFLIFDLKHSSKNWRGQGKMLRRHSYANRLA